MTQLFEKTQARAQKAEQPEEKLLVVVQEVFDYFRSYPHIFAAIQRLDNVGSACQMEALRGSRIRFLNMTAGIIKELNATGRGAAKDPDMAAVILCGMMRELLFAPPPSGDELPNQIVDMFLHGVTFGGHPVSSAVALANIELMKRENLLQNVLDNEAGLTAHLRRLEDLPIVGDVRGEGYLQVVELVRDPVTLETFSPEECKWLLKGLISNRLFEEGLMCRTDDRAEPLIVLSPPLIAGEREFALIESVLRTVLTEAWDALQSRPA